MRGLGARTHRTETPISVIRRELDAEGNVHKRRYIDLKTVTDERICDGYYFASAFKFFKRMAENPAQLNVPPEVVYEDID